MLYILFGYSYYRHLSKIITTVDNMLIKLFDKCVAAPLIDASKELFQSLLARSGSDDDKTKHLATSMQKILNVVEAFVGSDIYETAAPLQSALREDLVRLGLLLKAACCNCSMNPQEMEAMDSARIALIKSKSVFQSALTIYPAGTALCEWLIGKVAQCRKDIVLEAEIQQVGDFAANLKAFSKEAITKERDGDWDVSVPLQNKLADMVAKFLNFQESASERTKKACAASLLEIEARIQQLQSSLLEVGTMKLQNKFPKFAEVIANLVTGKLDGAKLTEALDLVSGLISYQCLAKVPLQKLLGKDRATTVEAGFTAVTSTARLLSGAFTMLQSLGLKQVSEELLFDERVVAFYRNARDQDHMLQIKNILPEWAVAIEEVAMLLENSVCSFMHQSTATFHGFVLRVMAPEVSLDNVLQTGVVGTVDADEKDRNCAFFQSVIRLVLVIN